jgi:hypothetical protein
VAHLTMLALPQTTLPEQCQPLLREEGKAWAAIADVITRPMGTVQRAPSVAGVAVLAIGWSTLADAEDEVMRCVLALQSGCLSVIYCGFGGCQSVWRLKVEGHISLAWHPGCLSSGSQGIFLGFLLA